MKVLRPNIEEEFARAIETYEWAAAQVEAMGGEAARLRPRLVIATFRQWTTRELDLRREAASASELRENMVAEPGYFVPAIDWTRTSRRVMTLEWIDGIKLTDREALIAAGHDVKALAAILVRAFLRQAVVDGFFHADLHQGNLFALPDGRLAAIDFGIMGRIDRQARLWLAEILYGLITGNYRRVAEIHFEAQYVPPHHNRRRVRDRAARGRRADPRTAGQGHFASARCSTGCSRSPATSTCRPSRICCCCRRRW